MSITPEQARELLDGATPGPWRSEYDNEIIETNTSIVLYNTDGDVSWGHNIEHDVPLIAAAPDLAQTIAGMRYEYAVEMMDDGEWKDIWDLWSTEKEARKEYASLAHSESVGDYRLVRRLVGPVEAVE